MDQVQVTKYLLKYYNQYQSIKICRKISKSILLLKFKVLLLGHWHIVHHLTSEFQSVAYDSSLFRTFYQGVKLTRENSIDGKEPIEVNQVAPTTIVTQDSDISKLRTE